MHRSSLSGVVSAPAFRLLRAVPRPAGLALAAALGAAGLVAVIPAGPASAASGSCTTSGNQVTCTFTETGAQATWTVPAGVTSAALTLYGGNGGAGGFSGGGGGGAGAEVTGTVSLSGISSLTVNVAGAGGPGAIEGIGGYGGGGDAGDADLDGGGGGGATTVADSAGTLLVAGGGGGGGDGAPTTIHANGGNGGNADTNGQPGAPLTDLGATVTGGGGGGAGTQMAGGDGGPGGGGTSSTSCSVSTGANGARGSSGQGGGSDFLFAGAGGGGGYFGGGQGGAGGSAGPPCGDTGAFGGGGGGSSFTGGPGVSGALVNDSPSAPASLGGYGEVIISYLLLAVTTTSLPAATGGHSYTATLAATGGVMPYSWSVPPGTLPPGLSLSSAGVISGIPDVAGTYMFTVKVTDAESTPMTATKMLSISVSGPVISALKPDHGPSFGGTVVEITGTGLACPRHDRSCRVSVTFGGHRAFVLSASPPAILVIAPPGHGTVQVTVTVGGVSSQATTAGLFTYQGTRFLP